MVVFTFGAIIKSLFARASNEEPGLRLDLARESKVRAMLDEVAARVGTRPVDTVYITTDTNIAVFERKHGERCLVLGAAVMDSMSLGAFKAILAHEYGHFSNRDTAGGGFALRVRRSVLTFILQLSPRMSFPSFGAPSRTRSGFQSVERFVSGDDTFARSSKQRRLAAPRWPSRKRRSSSPSSP